MKKDTDQGVGQGLGGGTELLCPVQTCHPVGILVWSPTQQFPEPHCLGFMKVPSHWND